MKGNLNESLERVIDTIALRNPLEPEKGKGDNIAMISKHIEKHLGVPERVFHEIHSEIVHIDVHLVGPQPGRNFQTLVTSGMSDKPMNTPLEARECRFIELMMCVPPGWPLGDRDFEDERNYWPIRWLKTLARMPHIEETWLGPGHTVASGDPPHPFASNTGFCGFLIKGPPIEYKKFFSLKVNECKTIYFLEAMPVYREEMEFALKCGSDALSDRLYLCGVSHVLDIKRRNVCKWQKRRRSLRR